MKVTDPSGQHWRVTRRWVPWRRRLKGALGSIPDIFPSGLGSDPISLVIGAVLLIVALPFLLLALVAGLELLLLLLVFPFALLIRVALGRHWTIEVRKGFRIHWQAVSGDWQASGSRIHEVAAGIERGEVPRQNVDVPADPDPEPGPGPDPGPDDSR